MYSILAVIKPNAVHPAILARNFESFIRNFETTVTIARGYLIPCRACRTQSSDPRILRHRASMLKISRHKQLTPYKTDSISLQLLLGLHTEPPWTKMASATELSSSKRKAFIPLENNPEVMSSLLHKLGLSSVVQFHDVFSIDSPELLAFIPRPAYALLLVFPVSAAYEQSRDEEDRSEVEYEGKGKGEEVMWFRQTIRNACGLIGLLHGVANGEAKSYIRMSPIRDLAKAVLRYVGLQKRILAWINC